MIFTGVVGLSVSLNGGVCTPAIYRRLPISSLTPSTP